jgi:DNA-directed RNA polymerase beta subunit
MSDTFENDINEIFKILNNNSDKKILKATSKQLIEIYNEFIKPNKIIKVEKKEKQSKKKSDDNINKRPKSSWMYYSMENRKKIKEDNPDKKMMEITTMLKNIWKEMDEKEKQIYEDKSEKDKIRYNNEKNNK